MMPPSSRSSTLGQAWRQSSAIEVASDDDSQFAVRIDRHRWCGPRWRLHQLRVSRGWNMPTHFATSSTPPGLRVSLELMDRDRQMTLRAEDPRGQLLVTLLGKPWV
jgi:hypothetical protein